MSNKSRRLPKNENTSSKKSKSKQVVSRVVIEGEGRLVATSDAKASAYTRGERVFHQKFGYGIVSAVEGNKLTVGFDKAGEKKVIDTFVERV